MGTLPSYTITEEVVLQTVEVGFRLQPDWQVSFTNPTAGPWKTIRFGDYVGGTDLKYAKEEDRPDLIVFNEKYSLFVILEAKDSILKLIAGHGVNRSESYPQLEKSIAVFHKEMTRIDTILKDPRLARLIYRNGFQDYSIVTGYIYPEAKVRSINLNKRLVELHHQIAQEKNEPRLDSCLQLVVRQEGLNLLVNMKAHGVSSEFEKYLLNALPFPQYQE